MNTHSHQYGCTQCTGTNIRYNAIRDTMILAGLHCSTHDYMNGIPSHNPGHTIDLVFTTNPELIYNITDQSILESDHYPIHITLSTKFNPVVYSQPRTRWRHIEATATDDQWNLYKQECDIQ